MTESAIHIKWAAEVAEHDYAAAEAYLSLKLGDSAVADAVKSLRKATLTSRRANDILRAAGLTAAPLDDPGVRRTCSRRSRASGSARCCSSGPRRALTSPTAFTASPSYTASTPTPRFR